ncbi:MAG: peptidoglycan-binding domain-containing protein [Solirubrobacteraceae bacterium]
MVAIVGVVVAVGAIVASGGSGSSGGGNGPAASAGAALVARRDLVATDTESGTLGYAESETVYDRLSGTVTSLPAVGEVIRQGQGLFRVDDTPVVLFDGGTPAYRVLSSSDRAGPDILELNRDLKALGFDSGDQILADDVWQPATTDAVELWQGSLGLAETGSIPLGRIVFLPGAQRVTAVNTVLGSTGQSAGSGSSGSGSGAATSTASPVIGRAEFVGLTTRTTATAPRVATGARRKRAAGPRREQPAPGGVGSSPAGGSGDSAAILSALKALLRAEAAQLKNSKSSAPSGSASGGSKGSGAGSGGGAAAQAILETASTKLVVSVALDASKRSEAAVGERVTVEMPDGSTVNGRVTQVSSVAQASSSANANSNSNAGGGSGAPSATVPVTVALTGRHRSLAGLDQAAVSVNFVQQQARHVLSVPVTALLATAGGGYDVQVAAPPHRLIAVTPGLFAAGYVQISGAGIYAGLQVTDSQG